MSAATQMDYTMDFQWVTSTPVAQSHTCCTSPSPLTLPIPRRHQQYEPTKEISFPRYAYCYEFNNQLPYILKKYPSDAALSDQIKPLLEANEELPPTSNTLPDNYYFMESTPAIKGGVENERLFRPMSCASFFTNYTKTEFSKTSYSTPPVDDSDDDFEDYATGQTFKPINLCRPQLNMSELDSLKSIPLHDEDQGAIIKSDQASDNTVTSRVKGIFHLFGNLIDMAIQTFSVYISRLTERHSTRQRFDAPYQRRHRQTRHFRRRSFDGSLNESRIYRIDCINDFYYIGPTLGIGGEGHVRLCIPAQLARKLNFPPYDHLEDKKTFLSKVGSSEYLYAIKITSKLNWKAPQQIYGIAQYLCGLPHPNIVRYHAVFTDSYNIYMVMDYVKGLELLEYLLSLDVVTERDCCSLFRQILYALAFTHRAGIIHRDIKPENFICASCTPEPPVILIDFGIATHRKHIHCVPSVGTPTYMAPELFSHHHKPPFDYDTSADMWSAGVILCQLLTGRTPFDERGPVSLIEQVHEDCFPEQTCAENTMDYSHDQLTICSEEFQVESKTQVDSRPFRSAETLADYTEKCSNNYSTNYSRPHTFKRHPTSHFKRGTIRFSLSSSLRKLSRSKSVIHHPREQRQCLQDSNNSEKQRSMSRSKSVCFNAQDSINTTAKVYCMHLDFEGDEWNHVADTAKDLVRSLLCLDPHQRLTAAEALNHPWFDQLNSLSQVFNNEIPSDVCQRWKLFLR